MSVSSEVETARRHRVLVIDDDPGTLEGFAGVLASEGFVVDTASSGQAGLVLAESTPFDVILADLRLPDLTGVEVLRHLRHAGVDTPCIIVTAFGSVASAVEALRLGAVDYVEKPLIGDDLVRVVRSASSARTVRGFSDTAPEDQTQKARRRAPESQNVADTPNARTVLDPRVREVMQTIERDPAGSYSLEDLAARVNLGASRLRQLFRDALGMSLATFRREKRLQLAADLLVTTHKRISEVAYEVGFANPAHFGKAFCRHFGVRPKTYRAAPGAGIPNQHR